MVEAFITLISIAFYGTEVGDEGHLLEEWGVDSSIIQLGCRSLALTDITRYRSTKPPDIPSYFTLILRTYSASVFSRIGSTHSLSRTKGMLVSIYGPAVNTS